MSASPGAPLDRENAAADVTTDAAIACAMFALDPVGLGGIAVRGGADVQAMVLDALRALLPQAPLTVPPHATATHLFGEEDLAAALSRTGHTPALARADGGVILLPGAERRDAAGIAPLLAVIDRGAFDTPSGPCPARFGVIAQDTGHEDEAPPPALLDRLAFLIAPEFPRDLPFEPPDTFYALPPSTVTVADETIEVICAASVAFGVGSLRAPVFAIRAARAAAALAGRSRTTEADAALAARLVLGPRATRLPAEAAPPERQDAPTEPQPQDAAAAPPENLEAGPPQAEETPSTEDLVIAAVRACVPPDLLARPPGAAPVRAKGRGAGDIARASGRGRPADTRRRSPRAGDRLAIAETLRAAAPWQRVRGAAPGRIAIRLDDIHVRRLRHRVTATTIFVVDASGSAARQRLAEAKGAVEALLGACYVRRDQVALIAFRGAGAETLVPPTRSLSRAKRLLAGLPGGGGTPVAAGLAAAHALADKIRRGGGSPFLVVLTDGRANIAADGAPGRPQALADAELAARNIAGGRVGAVLIDTGARPQPTAAALAVALSARYVPLPSASPDALAKTILASVPL